jgi:dipeptidyl aminopeptidase/acylaminoacyl peptidase
MSTATDNSKRPLTLEDLQRLSVVSTASMSADGAYLAYVNTRIIWEENRRRDVITVVEVSTGVVVKQWDGSAPQWSPVSNEVAYTDEYKGQNYIWVYSFANDAKGRLAPVYESHYFMGHLSTKNFLWSPDGKKIAYISADKPGPSSSGPGNVKLIERLLYKTRGGGGRPAVTDDMLSHVWIVSVASGESKLITDTIYNEHSICWSPDSTRIAFVSNRSADPDNNQLHDLWNIDLVSGTTTRHTETFGTVYQPAWSPDGNSIAFLATQSKLATNDSPAEDTQLYIVATATNTIHCLTQSFDRRIEQASWHPGGRLIYFTAGNEGTTAIHCVAANVNNPTHDEYPKHDGGGQQDEDLKQDEDVKRIDPKHIDYPTHVVGEECQIYEYSINKGGNEICFISTDATHPAEVFIHNLKTRSTRQITFTGDPVIEDCLLQECESFWFTSFDEKNIQGWIMKPALFNPNHKYPLVLVIHGGPHNMFGFGFEDRMQLLSAQGYGVLFINPRGSSGYGQAFSNGCVLNWGGGDYKDLMAGVDTAIEQYTWINADRLGVTGQSYGGYMTNWIITQTGRFKAAVSDGGISNLISFAGTSLYHSLIESEFNGSAYDNFPLLWQWSPLRNIKNVTTPTLIAHGELDNEVPLSQAEEMYIALKKLGVETSFVQYMGEGHGWKPDLKPWNRHDLLTRTLAWFDKYLQA